MLQVQKRNSEKKKDQARPRGLCDTITSTSNINTISTGDVNITITLSTDTSTTNTNTNTTSASKYYVHGVIRLAVSCQY